MAFSNLEKALAAVVGLDLLAPGTTRRAATAAVRAIPPLTTRVAAPAARGAGQLALAAARRNPATAVGLAGLGAYQAGVFDPVEEAIQMEVDRRMGVLGSEVQFQAPFDVPTAAKKTKRKVSAYAKGVKAGMKALKASKFSGKPGKLSNAKKAFSTVSKTVSALNKGKKVRRKGGTGVVARAASKIPGITSIKVRKQ
jgi:hypothetical protein